MSTRRALVSVFDKTGVVEFCRNLVELGFQIISTGGTAAALRDAGVAVTPVSELTGFPEVLGGRVKTLHPALHAGILADRGDAAHMRELANLGIAPIDLVAVNLYPFRETVSAGDVALETALENIDIGGPAMVRAAAKNFSSVVVVVDPGMYRQVVEEMRERGDVSGETRHRLATAAFRHTAHYDALISCYLGKEFDRFPEILNLTLEKAATLRYGENPHQRAAFYREPFVAGPCIAGALQLHGRELSFNNMNDANAALELVREFSAPAVVVVKHASPCSAATGASSEEAFAAAHEADPVSIFGGIVALNREVDVGTARRMARIFLEVAVAPGYQAEALEILRAKKELRILQVDFSGGVCADSALDLKKIRGGFLVQELDVVDFEPGAARVVTAREPAQDELCDLLFGWKVVKHVRSNAVVVARHGRTLGIGGGQANRIDAARQALERASEHARGAVLASDGFFPFPDVVEEAAKAGVVAIMQPGGSLRDAQAIEAADRSGLAMVFTGMRHFKH